MNNNNKMPPMPPMGVEMQQVPMIGPEQKKKINDLLRQLVFPVTLPPMQGLGFTKVDLYAGIFMGSFIGKMDVPTPEKIEEAATLSVIAAKLLFEKVRESYAADQKADEEKAKADKIIIP